MIDAQTQATDGASAPPTVAVAVITLDRPDCVRTCLDRLVAQRPEADEIVVVDASDGDATAAVVAGYPSVRYVRNRGGSGRMTTSRNIALEHVTSSVIAFVDDDAYAHDGWLSALRDAFAPGIGAVGGRAVQGHDDEASIGVDEIGRIRSNGTIAGHFAADPGRTIDVDHIMGCNMAYRRDVLARLGGFREDYTGISGVREDSDMCLRVRALGERLVFTPAAVVTHVGAPQAVGSRFDLRYDFYSQRNHLLMLVRNFGPRDRRVRRYLGHTARSALRGFVGRARAGRLAPAVARLAVTAAGTVAGLCDGFRMLLRTGTDPVRRDARGQELAQILTAPGRAPDVTA